MAGSYARIGRSLRVSCTVASIIIVQTVVCGLAAVPSVAVWRLLAALPLGTPARVL